MPLQTIIHANGPLPLTGTFTPLADGPIDLIITGTAWTTTAPVKNRIHSRLKRGRDWIRNDVCESKRGPHDPSYLFLML